jgi:outer membrane protein OmpA-like peptidoglycan-associated protein
VAKGYGSADPVASNGTQEGRQQNRRVVVRYQP